MTRILNSWADGAGRQTAFMFGLVILFALTIAWGLAGIIRGFDLALALAMAFVGSLCGLVLGKMIRNQVWAGMSLIGLAGLSVVIAVGNLGLELFTFSKSIALFGNIRDGIVEFNSASQALFELAEGIGILSGRVSGWARGFFVNAPVFDPVAAAVVWAALVWLCSAWAGLRVASTLQTFHATFPLVALLVLPYAHSGTDPSIFSVLLLFLFSLMVLGGQLAREGTWRRNEFDFSEEIRFDLALWCLPIVVLVVALSAIAPSASIQDLLRMSQHVAQSDDDSSRISNSLGLSSNPRPKTAFDQFVSPGLPRNHLIGAGPELSRQPVMSIKVDGDSARVMERGYPYYWQGSTYDIYFGVGWTTSPTSIMIYPGGVETSESRLQSRRLVGQQVNAIISDGLIYGAGELVKVDVKYSVAWRSEQDAFGASTASSEYKIDNWVSTASASQLQKAGTDYPQAVRERYLALPNNIPSRVWALARDLTATKPTPYDRVRAIEERLREYPYTLDLPEPPANHDIVDYFLFDLKRGYCDYYATAFVVLARMSGVPSRLVVGYAPGRYDSSQGSYLVTQADAHSWPQAYFPSYGWISFEPTSGRAPLEQSTSMAKPQSDDFQSEGRMNTPDSRGVLLIEFLALFALAFIGVLASLAFDNWRLRRLNPDESVREIYRRLVSLHSRICDCSRPGETAYHVSAQLKAQLNSVAGSRYLTNRILAIQIEIDHLTEICVQSFYAQPEPDARQQLRAIELWHRLRLPLWTIWAIRKSLELISSKVFGKSILIASTSVHGTQIHILEQ